MDEGWLKALGTMPHGIYVLTTRDDRRINGMIVSWVSQISHDPPLILVAVHPNRYSHSLIKKSKVFALHIISRRHTEYVTRFKGADPEAKFHSLKWTEGKTGCPILGECLGYVECVVKAEYAPGNHTLFVGEVVNGQMFSDDRAFSTLDYEGVYIGKT